MTTAPSPLAAPCASLEAPLRIARDGAGALVERLAHERRLLLAAPPGAAREVCARAARALRAERSPDGEAGTRGPVLVVTAARAQARDHARALAARGVAALAPCGRPRDAVRRLERLQPGPGPAGPSCGPDAAAGAAPAWIFVTPEDLTRHAVRARLAAFRTPLLVIGEAHRAGALGGELLPAYRALPPLLAALPGAALLLLCGAAPPGACADALARLGLDPSTPRFVWGFERPRLALRVVEPLGRRARARAVDALLLEWIGTPRSARGGALVVAGTRRCAELEAARLARRGYRALPLHAGLPVRRRDRLRRAFAAGRFEVAVASEDLAAELERADLRAVVHREPPASLEAFCDVAWRAGVDGRPAAAAMLVAPGDAVRRRRRFERDACALARAALPARWARFRALVALAYSSECRMAAVLGALGATGAEPCGRCDVCASRVPCP